MTTLILKTQPVHQVQQFIKTTVISVFDTLQLWSDRREQRKRLSLLSDHMLRDIGLTKIDVIRECHKPFWK